MKKILLLILLTGLLISQEAKKGIGFEFHMFPSIWMSDGPSESGSSMGVYFPFETPSGLFIEPLITYSNSLETVDYNSYYNNSNSENYEKLFSSWEISLGMFKSTYLNKMRTYVGIRVGKRWTVSDESGQHPDYGSTITSNEQEWDALIISPTFGAEYFINEKFSFGGEAMYSMLSSENETEELDIYNNANTVTSTKKTSMIIPKFMVRFYY